MFANNGSPTLVAGPAWSNSTAGAGSRGAGANSAQLARVQGFWVNAVSMIGTNGGSSFTIAANQCSYMGSISIDSTIGQVSALQELRSKSQIRRVECLQSHADHDQGGRLHRETGITACQGFVLPMLIHKCYNHFYWALRREDWICNSNRNFKFNDRQPSTNGAVLRSSALDLIPSLQIPEFAGQSSIMFIPTAEPYTHASINGCECEVSGAPDVGYQQFPGLESRRKQQVR